MVFAAGHTGSRFATAELLPKLDKNTLPNLGDLDPSINRGMAAFDPENANPVPYMWRIAGIGYNPAKVAANLSDAGMSDLAGDIPGFDLRVAACSCPAI